MKIASWTAVGLLLGVSVPSSALTVEIVITGPAKAGYALTVGDVTKNGRLADRTGKVTSREAVDVAPQSRFLPARLTFFGEQGPVAVCPPVKVVIEERGAACTPSFTMVRQGGEQAACRASCERPQRHGGDSDETFVARAR